MATLGNPKETIAILNKYRQATQIDNVQLNKDIEIIANFENKSFARLGAAAGKSKGTDFDVFPMYGNRKRITEYCHNRQR